MAKRTALCIGINAYPGGNRLSGCVADANSWWHFFSQMGFKGGTLTDREATYSEMVRRIEQIIHDAQPGDVVAVQYSGHGTKVRADDSPAGNDTSAPREGIVPVDFASEGIIVDHTLGPIFDSAKPGVAINVFFDCCFSGDATRLLAPTPAIARAADDPSVKARVMYLTDDMVKVHYAAEKRRAAARSGVSGTVVSNPRMREVLFSASQSNQVSFESGGQGQFTRAAMSVVQRISVAGLTNTTFIQEVIAAMGSSGSFSSNVFSTSLQSQTPQMQTAPELLNARFLGPTTFVGTGSSDTASGLTREDLLKILFGANPVQPAPAPTQPSGAVTFDDLIAILNNASRAVRDAKHVS
ncbi:MAG: caspase family protein [Planctomycetaceae bacterium]